MEDFSATSSLGVFAVGKSGMAIWAKAESRSQPDGLEVFGGSLGRHSGRVFDFSAHRGLEGRWQAWDWVGGDLSFGECLAGRSGNGLSTVRYLWGSLINSRELAEQ